MLQTSSGLGPLPAFCILSLLLSDFFSSPVAAPLPWPIHNKSQEFSFSLSFSLSITYRHCRALQAREAGRETQRKLYLWLVNRKQLARLLARVCRRSPARAADEIDTLVYRMLKDLKRPFLGSLTHSSTAAGSATPTKRER